MTLMQSPMWQISPCMCRSVIIDGVTARSHGPNNDGCDPESCHGVWIKNCTFDTGDDCISLKSGRDRDGREAAMPCEYVLIENNDFADGHGGVAIGSEMSGGIRYVLAMGNHFRSPNLTYALRLKTNARRGGYVEKVMLCDSVISAVHGAAFHGTMLYEDGRNGEFLPAFRDIQIENIKAFGGDYGIFLEAFPEVPVTGLVLKNIAITGVTREMRSMNWKDARVENVTINGKSFPRPGYVRIKSVPHPSCEVEAASEGCGGEVAVSYIWEISSDGETFEKAGEGERFSVPAGASFIRLRARDEHGNEEMSCPYRVLPKTEEGEAARLLCRGMYPETLKEDEKVTRGQLSRMLLPLADRSLKASGPSDTREEACAVAAANRFFPLNKSGRFEPERTVTRQEMATVAMQACGVNYRNASSTYPVCRDSGEVDDNYATNVARALYFGFMELCGGYFYPGREVLAGEAMAILNRVADFAGR